MQNLDTYSKTYEMSTYDPERTDEAWHLLRKVFLLLLIATALALGLVLLSRQKNNVPIVLFNILADASMGLLAGVAARLVLNGRNAFVQGLAAAAVSIVGLAVLGYFTDWRSGIGPFRVALISVPWLDSLHPGLRLPLQFSRSGMNLLDLAQMILAVDTSWVALRVWRPSSRRGARSAVPSPRVKRPARSHSTRSSAIPVPPAPRVPVTSGSGVRTNINRKKVRRPLISRPAPAIPIRAKPRRLGGLRRRAAVQLAVHEEHRCPYCLEPVNPNDPRGTVECQVCHTLHHKDCWDITGSCQVPHLNT